MLLKPFHVGPGPPAILRWPHPFPANTDRIETPWRQGPESFEADVAGPLGAKVIHIPESLTAVETQVVQQDLVGGGPTVPIFPAINMEAVQMLITPGKHDLEDGVELR
jgi:hypothetical protein